MTHKLYYHLWSNKHSRWWKPDAMGYTAHIDEAGVYTEEQAVEHVVQAASNGLVSLVTCMVVAAPRFWPTTTKENDDARDHA
jgi:hypothetical protein